MIKRERTFESINKTSSKIIFAMLCACEWVNGENCIVLWWLWWWIYRVVNIEMRQLGKGDTLPHNLPYWFGITSGSVSSPSGGSWSFINWWCRELMLTLAQLFIIGIDEPLVGTVTVRACDWAASNWQSACTGGNWVCFADFMLSLASLLDENNFDERK